MEMKRTFWIALVIVMGTAPLALATPAAAENQPAEGAYVVPLPRASTLADNVVVGAPAAPAPVVVSPGQPVAAAPVVVDPGPPRKEVIRVDTAPPRNFMSTIALSAFMGGVSGALIGSAIYYLGSQTHARNIVYWTAGGVLVGTGVGLTQILVDEGRPSQVGALSDDPAPTFRLALFHKEF